MSHAAPDKNAKHGNARPKSAKSGDNGRQPYLGLIGNGETAALIAPDLAIQWFCPGRFDAFPLFAGALDPRRGGKFSLTFRCGSENLFEPRQRYLDGTNILDTVIDLAADRDGRSVRAEVFDYFPWRKPCLIRDIKLTNETQAAVRVDLEWSAEPVKMSAYPIQSMLKDGITVFESRDWAVACGMATEKTLVLPAGGEVWARLALAYAETPGKAVELLQEARPVFREDSPVELSEARRFWASWLADARDPFSLFADPHGAGQGVSKPLTPALLDGSVILDGMDLKSAYRRSLLVLKLLVYEPTGAIIAAPTASFPATPGGGDNWDYRYAWLRDGYLCALTFDEAGLSRESRRFYDFVRGLQAEDGSWPNPLCDIDGNRPEETIVSELEGPGGEQPVRFGNAALSQFQLDNTGNVIDGLWRHYLATGDINYLASWWPPVLHALNWLEANWHRPEHGIWEFRDALRQWIYGKVLCYAAFEAGAQIAEKLGHASDRERWKKQAASVHEEVISRGWSPERKAFTQFYGVVQPDPANNDGTGHPPATLTGGPPLDISVLALAFYGLLDPSDPRMEATVRAIEAPNAQSGLNMDGGIARFEGAALPFYLPTLWLARYHLLAGNKARALELITLSLQCATDLDLMAEHFDPVSSRQWGNFPQAFSHEELVRTLFALAKTQGPLISCSEVTRWGKPGVFLGEVDGEWSRLLQ